MNAVRLVAFSLALSVCPLASAIEDAASSNVEAKLAEHDLAVVEVFRPGCPMCAKMSQVIARFEAANPSTPVYRILVSDEEFGKKYQVSAIPAFLVFKQGRLSHVFFGLMDNDQFYQSVYYEPVAVRDPKGTLAGVMELMNIPPSAQLMKIPGGYYAVLDSVGKIGYGRVQLDGTVLDAENRVLGTVRTEVPPGACCSHGK